MWIKTTASTTPRLECVITEIPSRCFPMQNTLDICANFNGPFYHIWGNHELYNFTKDQLAESPLNSSIEHSLANNGDKSEEPSNSENICNYYHFCPMGGFRIVAIDTYDVSVLGCEPTSSQFAEAEQLYLSKNPNDDKNSYVGTQGLDARFLMYNGGVGQKQLQWLREVLESASNAQEKVLIMGRSVLGRDCIFHPQCCIFYPHVWETNHYS